MDDQSQLLLEIAHCSHVRECLANPTRAHPCGKIVRTQNSTSLGEHQVPEPWSGHLSTASLLFIASNPSISTTEYYPKWSDSEGDIISYFSDRFVKYVVDGKYYRNLDGTLSKPIQYWANARQRAMELYDRSVIPGKDYALTEVVHCKSEKNRGVDDALDHCVDRYLDRVLGYSASRIIVVIGDKAKGAVVRKYRVPVSTHVHGPAVIAGRKRFVVFLAAPGSGHPREGYPRTFREVQLLPFVPILKRALINPSN